MYQVVKNKLVNFRIIVYFCDAESKLVKSALASFVMMITICNLLCVSHSKGSIGIPKFIKIGDGQGKKVNDPASEW